MAEIIRQSTSKVVVFQMFLTDHVTAATGATVAVTIRKLAGFINPSVGAATATEIAFGWYYFNLSATDTNTAGPLVLRATATGCDAYGEVFTCGQQGIDFEKIDNTDVELTFGPDVIFSSVPTIAQILAALTTLTGTAQAGAATTITLAAGASATNDLYNGQSIWISSGTGAGQRRTITDYVGSTKVATVDEAWVTNPAVGSIYVIGERPAVVRNVTVST